MRSLRRNGGGGFRLVALLTAGALVLAPIQLTLATVSTATLKTTLAQKAATIHEQMDRRIAQAQREAAAVRKKAQTTAATVSRSMAATSKHGTRRHRSGLPDGLSAGAAQGHNGSVLLLTPSAMLDLATGSTLGVHKDDIASLRFIGSDAAIAPVVRTEVAARLNERHEGACKGALLCGRPVVSATPSRSMTLRFPVFG